MSDKSSTSHDGYRKEYSATELLELAKVCWEDGFASVRLDDAKALLEELIGLGVLIKRENGMYRLRSGNVVRALGSDKEINDRLDYLSQLPPPAQSEDSQIYRVRTEQKILSPLSVKQAGDLLTKRAGMGFVFGSEALGLSEVYNTLEHILKSRSNNTEQYTICEFMPPDIATSEQFLNYLEKKLKPQQRDALICCGAAQLMKMDEEPASLFEQAAKLFTKKSRRASRVRFIVLFAPEMACQWMSQEKERTQKIEGMIDTSIYLDRVNEAALRRFLSDEELISTSPVMSEVVKITGGWPFLVRQMLSELDVNGFEQNNPQKAAQKLANNLQKNEANITESFVKSTGLDHIPYGRELLNGILDFSPLSHNDVLDLYKEWDITNPIMISPEEVETSIDTMKRLGFLIDQPKGIVAEPVIAEAIRMINDDMGR